MKEKVLITGSAGLIGSYCARFFHEQGFQIFGVDNDSRSYFFGPSASTAKNRARLEQELTGYSHYDIDIRDKAAIDALFGQHQFSAIIHAAAQPSHDWAAREPLTDFGINALGTLNLLESYRANCPDAVFIFTSTNKVYGDNPNKLPLQEQDTRYEIDSTHPYAKGIDETMSLDGTLHSLFGVSKAAADLSVQEYGKYWGLKTGVFRGGCLTGPAHTPSQLHGFLAYLVHSIGNEQPYEVFGYKGKQVRDNIHAHDVARAFYFFYQNPKPGEVYNLGGTRFSNTSILEAVPQIEDRLSKKAQLAFNPTNRIGDHIWYVSSMEKFKNHFPGWEHQYDMGRILDDLCDSFLRNN